MFSKRQSTRSNSACTIEYMPTPAQTFVANLKQTALKRTHIDWLLFLAVSALMLFSVAFVYSASAYFADIKFGSPEKLFVRHLVNVLLSFVVIIVFAKIDYHLLQKHTRNLMIFALFCLVAVIVVGTTIKGAKRWINVGPLNFQPSELAKFALVLHLARMMAEKQEYIKDMKRAFLPLMFWIAVTAGCIAIQPNFSTAGVIFLLGMILVFIGNGHVGYIALTFLAGIAGGGAYAISAPYRMKRLAVFWEQLSSIVNVEVITQKNYQLYQAILAFGNGGIFGVGPGQSRQRDWFLPESYGDFIFSIIGEEYGFIGVLAIMFAFALILWRGFIIARTASDDFGRFVAGGITTTFALYAVINMGVTTGLLPTTGLPLPFISYGGTAILFSAAALGILLNISSQASRS
jgi:cell division protein FtsW